MTPGWCQCIALQVYKTYPMSQARIGLTHDNVLLSPKRTRLSRTSRGADSSLGFRKQLAEVRLSKLRQSTADFRRQVNGACAAPRTRTSIMGGAQYEHPFDTLLLIVYN